MDNKDKNKKNLDDAIRRLPMYEPKDDLWDKINEHLELNTPESQLNHAIAGLPTYDAPDFIWNKIESELEDNIVSVKTAKIRRISWIQVAAACFIVAIMAVSIQWQFRTEDLPVSEAIVRISYDQEAVPMLVSNKSIERSDDEAFEMIATICKQKNIVCSQSTFKTLRSELEELDWAKKQLEKNVNTYDTGSDLQIQLARIERDRTSLLKQMMKMTYT